MVYEEMECWLSWNCLLLLEWSMKRLGVDCNGIELQLEWNWSATLLDPIRSTR